MNYPITENPELHSKDALTEETLRSQVAEALEDMPGLKSQRYVTCFAFPDRENAVITIPAFNVPGGYTSALGDAVRKLKLIEKEEPSAAVIVSYDRHEFDVEETMLSMAWYGATIRSVSNGNKTKD